jgi:hypothetical protein
MFFSGLSHGHGIEAIVTLQCFVIDSADFRLVNVVGVELPVDVKAFLLF